MANNKTDYTKPHTDLVELLPEPLRSDVNLSLFNNVFNRYLTKQEIEKVAGYIGRGNTAAIRPRQIHEQDVHRQAYQLQPIPYNKIGTIEHMTSWKDMQNELERLGVDMDAFSEWGATQKFNWVPPIDINKIINYRDYYWVDPDNANSVPQYITIRSTCATATARFNFWDSIIEQHGSTFQISDILTSNATPLTYIITEFVDAPDSIKIDGDFTSDILLGDFIDVVGSANNDETYRITATPTYSGVTNETLLLVDKPIIADTPSSTARVSTRRFDKIVLPANTTLVGSPPVEIKDLGNYTSLFTEGFIFFIRNSTNTNLDSTFIETISSSYDALRKETTVTINQRVTDDTADGEISLEEEFSLLEADMKCQCDDFGGWDISPWDDNPLSPLWGDSENATGATVPDGISDHENLITRISNTTPPVSGNGIEGELWYDTIENILYQNSAVPLTVSRTDQFVVAFGSPVNSVFNVNSVISSNTIVTAERTSGGSPINLNVSYVDDGTTTEVTVLDTLSTSDIIEITYETPVWTVIWRNFSLILDQTTGIDLWDLSLSCDNRPRITATEQWVVENKWLHKNDVVNFTSVQRANQPIIEYDWDLELNEWTYVKHNWSYRALEDVDFEVSTVTPPRIELEKLVWWEYAEEGNPSPSNEIIFDDRYGDLTDYFATDREVFFVENLFKTSYTVVSSSYKTAPADGVDAVFPYRTYVTFNKTLPVPTPYVRNNLSISAPNAISIIPILTTHGDTWDDYSTHWLHTSVDDSLPSPHQSLNPFIDIDVTQTTVLFPPVIFNVIAEPLDFVSTNTFTVIGGDFEVDWGDGNYTAYVAGAASSIASGTVTIRSINVVTKIFFSTDTFTDINMNVSSTITDLSGSFENVAGLTTFAMADASNVTNMFQAWNFCSLTSFPLIDTSSCNNFGGAWAGNPFTSFPEINTALGEDFDTAWNDCDGLTSFPSLNFSAATTMGGTWGNCDALVTFPDIDIPLCTWMRNMFSNCPSLETIGTLNTASGTRMGRMFTDCTSLTCISDVNTTNVTLASGADDMFTNTPLLTAPSAAEQTTITTVPGGLNYINSGTCPPAAGSPIVGGSPAAGSPIVGGSPAAGSPIVGGSPAAGSPIVGGSPAAGSPPAPLVSSWDIDTARYASPTVIAPIQAGYFPSGLCFGDNGTKLYTIQDNNNDAYQYAVGIPYDITTLDWATESKTVRFTGATENTLNSIEFNDTGSRMYLTGNGNEVYTFAVPTPWDINSISITPALTDPLDITPLDGASPTGAIHFSADGLTLFQLFQDSGWVYQYSLGSPFLMSSLVQPSTKTIDLGPNFGVSIDNNVSGIHVSNDGTLMQITDNVDEILFQFILGTPWDVTTATLDTQIDLSTFGSILEVTFNPAGTLMFIQGSSNFRQTTIVTPFDIGSILPDDRFIVGDSTPEGLVFSPDGMNMYIAGDTLEGILQYTLGTAWRVDTSVFLASKVIIDEVAPRDVAFNDDGTKMYVGAIVADAVYEYDVPIPWSVASVSGTHTASLSTVGEDGNPFGIHFSATGDKCFIMGRNTGFIYQYDLPTPWDLSSNVLGVTASTSVVAEVETGQGEDVYFSGDGLKMYVIKVRSAFPSSRNIYQYTLASAWDLSGLVTYDNISFDPSLQDLVPTGMTMSPDGLDMYIVGDSTNTVYHYSIDPI